MVVMVLERTTPSLRGHLSRWLIEVKAGVFVGKVSALVRDKLWEMMCEKRGDGAILQVWSTNNQQGFAMRLEGERDRVLIDMEGITLIKRLTHRKKEGTDVQIES